VLKKYLPAQPIFFDVGANIGEYAVSLQKAFPQAQIFSFEPSPATYQKLVKTTQNTSIKCIPLGLGAAPLQTEIYTYANDDSSWHASLYKEVFEVVHNNNQIQAIGIELSTVDIFCQQHNIPAIDFLKIDIEGNELDALKGAQQMLASQKIRIIQFEFGAMNVISRTFLKDFYDLLKGYNFYRCHTQKLEPLGAYNPIHEIFQFQNILAIQANIDTQNK
jgi:FkbM family methyltransferase